MSDAYEFSLVAVPAQKAAGVRKSYTGETVEAPPGVTEKEADQDTRARVRLFEIQSKNNSIKNYQEE